MRSWPTSSPATCLWKVLSATTGSSSAISAGRTSWSDCRSITRWMKRRRRGYEQVAPSRSRANKGARTLPHTKPGSFSDGSRLALARPSDTHRGIGGRDQDDRWPRRTFAVRPQTERLLERPLLSRVLDRDPEGGIVRVEHWSGTLGPWNGAEELHRAAALVAFGGSGKEAV